MIISRTPFRISFFGGGTDYPAWYLKHGGDVIATSIDKYCYLTCRYLPPFFENTIRVVWSKIENCKTIEEITHPAVRGILQYLRWDRGIEIHHVGDLPARGGMGSSSSFIVGLLHALHGLNGHTPSKYKLAGQSIYVEQEILKETVGSQDQVSAAFGGLNHITFLPNGEFSVNPLTLSQERLRELNNHMLLFYTGIRRTASDIADTYIKDIDRNTEQLKLINRMVHDSLEILSGNDDLTHFGKLLHESWSTKRSLSSSVSNKRIDEIYDQAISNGAFGGKLIGAGGGGFMLFMAPPSKHKRIKERLNNLLYVPFKFESSGSQIIFFDSEQDYSSIEKIRSLQTIQSFKELDQI